MYAFRGYPPFDSETRFWHVIKGKQMNDAAVTYYDPAQVIEYMKREGGISRFWPSDDFKPKLVPYTPRKAIGPPVMNRAQAIQILRNAEPWTGVEGTGPVLQDCTLRHHCRRFRAEYVGRQPRLRGMAPARIRASAALSAAVWVLRR